MVGQIDRVQMSVLRGFISIYLIRKVVLYCVNKRMLLFYLPTLKLGIPT
jgi:hypothetical protein